MTTVERRKIWEQRQDEHMALHKEIKSEQAKAKQDHLAELDAYWSNRWEVEKKRDKLKGKDLWADQNWDTSDLSPETSPARKNDPKTPKRGKNFERLTRVYAVMHSKTAN